MEKLVDVQREKSDAVVAEIAADDAAQSFAALGASVRLAILRRLVRAGPDGTPVGALQDSLGIAASTLSHHLRALGQAGLIRQIRDGRTLRCVANFDMIEALAAFLINECCADRTELDGRSTE